MTNLFKVFHSYGDNLRPRVHLILVRPEVSQNVGAAARAACNMGIRGGFHIVGSPGIVDEPCRRLAKHAGYRLDAAQFHRDLAEALASLPPGTLSLAATARSGSPHRPHPREVRAAVAQATDRLKSGQATDLALVFGPESDGLSNEEVERCDWVVTIPSAPEYRSLNLAQSVLIFSYEVNQCLLEPVESKGESDGTQRDRVIARLVEMAEKVGFILPGDPHKMKPRLETIFSCLPARLEVVRTLHGLMDQVLRTLETGRVEYRGRYKQEVEKRYGVK